MRLFCVLIVVVATQVYWSNLIKLFRKSINNSFTLWELKLPSAKIVDEPIISILKSALNT